MKTLHKVIAIVLIVLATTATTNLMAQAPPPPPPDHGQTGNQNGGNAPVGSGVFILLVLGATYSGKKIYDQKKEILEE